MVTTDCSPVDTVVVGDHALGFQDLSRTIAFVLHTLSLVESWICEVISLERVKE